MRVAIEPGAFAAWGNRSDQPSDGAARAQYVVEVAEANSMATVIDSVRADRRRWNFEPRSRSLSVMATAPHPTVAELRTSGIVASTEIVAAVTAYVHDPDGGS